MAYTNKQMIDRDIARMINFSQNVRASLAKELTTSNSKAEYALRWMDNAYKATYIGWVFEDLDAKVREHGHEKAIADMLDWARDQRNRYWSPHNSTSPYANACNNEKYDALREVIDKLEQFQHYLKEFE